MTHGHDTLAPSDGGAAGFEAAPGELNRCRLAGAILSAYRLTGSPRRWRIGRQLAGLALRLEGGHYYSETIRRLLAEHHGIRVGAYSYGACLQIGVWPPGVSVGRYVSVAYSARVHTQNHPLDRLSTHPVFYDSRLGAVEHDQLADGDLRIEHDAWIGDQAIILPGCRRVGLGAVVGAGAVVTRDVDDFAIVGGNPAKVIKYRFDEPVRDVIRASRWWRRPIGECLDLLDHMLEPVGIDPVTHPLLRSKPGPQEKGA